MKGGKDPKRAAARRREEVQALVEKYLETEEKLRNTKEELREKTEELSGLDGHKAVIKILAAGGLGYMFYRWQAGKK